jgi:hypothetical protein
MVMAKHSHFKDVFGFISMFLELHKTEHIFRVSVEKQVLGRQFKQFS